jgi:LuxR family quorum-sensing system transcriptional regulator CciR
MTTIAAIKTTLESFKTSKNLAELSLLLSESCQRLGFDHFAMVQHVDLGRSTKRGFRIHNYPQALVDLFDRQGLGITDPVHRASHTTVSGFRWADVPDMIPLSDRDRQVLEAARVHGLTDGYTVPAHVPGELLGSCTFARAANDDAGSDMLPVAHLVGQFAFEASRRMTGTRKISASLTLTSRQLECIMYVGRGKTDAEIAEILGLSENTIVEHLKNARRRCNAAARAVLPVRALYDGALSFADVLVS